VGEAFNTCGLEADPFSCAAAENENAMQTSPANNLN